MAKERKPAKKVVKPIAKKSGREKAGCQKGGKEGSQVH